MENSLYTIQDIISIISDKRTEYIDNYGNFPNTMEISKSILMCIKMQFLVTVNVPLENIKVMYGMNIKINDNIDIPEEIKIYYEEADNDGIMDKKSK